VNPEPPQPDEEDSRSGPGQWPPAPSPSSADRPQPWRSPSGGPDDAPATPPSGDGQTGSASADGQPGYGQAGYGQAGYGPTGQQPGYGGPAGGAPGYSPTGSGPDYGQGAPPTAYGQPGSRSGYGAAGDQPGYRPPGDSGRRRPQPGFDQAETQAAIRNPAGTPPGYSPPGSPTPPGYSPPGSPTPPGYSPPGYSPPGSPADYGQAGSPGGYSQPGYRQSSHDQPGYGEAGSPGRYGEPGYGPPGYGQPGYGQAGSPGGYGQPGSGQPGSGQPGSGQPGYGGAGSPAGYRPPGGQPGYGPSGPQAGYGPGGAQGPYPYAGAQPGYGGGQNPTMAFPGGPAPGSGKRRRGPLIGIAATVVVIVVAAVSLALVLGGGDSPTTMALKAGQAIGVADGVTYAGTISGSPADLSVTRAGTVEGTYTAAGRPVSRVTVQGVTYLNAPTAFWTAEGIGGTEAGQAGGHWAKAPAASASISFDSLTPVQIARALRNVGPNPQSVKQTFHGKKIIVLAAGGVSYYITASNPHRLIHVTGGSGVGAYSFDVKPLTAAAVKPVFTSLHSDVQALVGAADPAAVVDGGTPKFLDCNGATRCTVSSAVTVTDPTTSGSFSTPPVLLKMTVGFAPNQNGKPFANCSTTVAVPSAAAVRPACGVTGGAWTTWFNSHSGHFNVWADAAYRVTVNSASSVATLQTALSQEQGAG
jgi:hypothetical protein